MSEGIAHITSKIVLASIQDKGRFGFRNQGIPSNGPMDLFSHNIANALLGNDENDAVLEVFNIPFSLRFNQNCMIGIAGIDISFMINNVIHKESKTVSIQAGDELHLTYSPNACWKYISIKSGWQSSIVLGSRSSNSALGMEILKTNTILNYEESINNTPVKYAQFQSINRPIKIYCGPESQLFDKEELTNAFDKIFIIDNQSNRMAYRFKERLELNSDTISINSSAVFPGIVQLTPSGEFFILMRDCQTTGGYPRIGYIKEEGINLLAQKKIGGQVKFEFMSI